MSRRLQKLVVSLGIRAIAAVAAILVLAVTGLTADVGDYQARIDSAIRNIGGLRMKDQPSTDNADTALIENILGNIPRTEKIDLPGTTVETDNRWLHEAFTSIAESDLPEQRSAILLSLEERLTATAQQLRQLENVTALSASKDDSKRKIAEILRRPEFQPPEAATESLFQRWVREFTEWLARVFPRAPILPDTPSGAGTVKYGLMIVLFLFIIGIIGYLMYKFAPMLSYRREGRRERREDKVILGERVSGELSARDLFSEAEALAQQGNLRGAIRKGYISLLCDLSDRKLLRLARHKTNKDYLKDVKGHPSLFEKMNGLTNSFERNWYGLRSVDRADWEEFRFTYDEALQNAKEQRQ
jgi:hypothetical protein